MARGDERLSSLYDFLFQQGVKLEAWREHFSSEPYEAWFEINGIDKQLYLGKREPGSILAWSFIDSGVTEDFLRKEYGRADSAEKTADCYNQCSACGLKCSDVPQHAGLRTDNLKIESVPELNSITEKAMEKIEEESETGQVPKRFTFRYTKYGDSRYLGHIDTMNILLRAIRASGVNIRMHRKYHPVPKIVLSDALPVGIESMCELIEIEAVPYTMINNSILQTINTKLPEGMEMRAFIEGSLKDMVKEYVYVLVSKASITDGEYVPWKKSEGKYFYLWRGSRIKDVWSRGLFQRIIKIEAEKLNGI
ncbi:MAG TPA: TIGR03936 family radical SAM-associated protein [Syntrophorhabdaceae bacterium]|nr:TIGR03936 family radical SAM-associated protein [Syntrophorhabdaceae bacterium]